MNDTDKRDDDARLMFQITVDDIKVGKNRLWISTYYILSLYAGLIAFSLSSNLISTTDWLRKSLIIFGALITLFAIYHLIESHASIVKYRKRLKSVTLLLHKEVRELYTTIPGYDNFNRYFISLTFPLILLIIGGYLLVLLSFFKSTATDSDWINLPLAIIIILALSIYDHFKKK